MNGKIVVMLSIEGNYWSIWIFIQVQIILYWKKKTITCSGGECSTFSGNNSQGSLCVSVSSASWLYIFQLTGNFLHCRVCGGSCAVIHATATGQLHFLRCKTLHTYVFRKTFLLSPEANTHWPQLILPTAYRGGSIWGHISDFLNVLTAKFLIRTLRSFFEGNFFGYLFLNHQIWFVLFLSRITLVWNLVCFFVPFVYNSSLNLKINHHVFNPQCVSGEGLLVGLPLSAHICVSVCAHLPGQQAGLRLRRDQ